MDYMPVTNKNVPSCTLRLLPHPDTLFIVLVSCKKKQNNKNPQYTPTPKTICNNPEPQFFCTDLFAFPHIVLVFGVPDLTASEDKSLQG